MSRNLIIYYSRKGQNYVNGSIRELSKGNTEIVAEFIQKAVGGDLFEIETVKEYSRDYMTCTEEAQEELRAKARPELKAYLNDHVQTARDGRVGIKNKGESSCVRLWASRPVH